jgi:hypothetical protein
VENAKKSIPFYWEEGIQYFLHGYIEEDGEEELVVNCHGDEAALVEFRGSLPHLDAQADTPQQEQELHWNNRIFYFLFLDGYPTAGTGTPLKQLDILLPIP